MPSTPATRLCFDHCDSRPSFCVVSGQQNICTSLDAYQDLNGLLLASCSVLPNDMPECLTLTCVNTNNTRQIASFVVTFLPCGESGREQLAVHLSITDFSSSTLLSRVFSNSESDIAIGQGTRLGITLRHLPLGGITFGVISILMQE